MIVLCDTGVLLRFLEPTDPLHNDARRAVTVLSGRGDEHVMAQQNLVEFWNVCTRPKSARQGLGLSIAETERRLTRLDSMLSLMVELPSIITIWRQLVFNHSVRGRQVHDAKLVALMMAHGIDTILTFNGSDFSRFPGITAIDPRTV
jgi:predicted nucleic acid-binding protein